MNARRFVVAGLLVAGLVLAAAAPAPASASPPNERFVLVAADIGGSARLVATGPVSGVGTDTVLGHTDNADGTFTDTDRFDLPTGQVFLSDTYTVEITTEAGSCSSIIDVHGTWTVTGGNGAFTGVTGGGTFIAAGVFVAGRDSSGQCLGFDAPPRAYAEVVRGTGTTHLP